MYYSKSIRVSEQLAEDLFCNRYGSDAMLPSENTLAAHYGVSRVTMRRAIDILEGSGMLYREPSRGVRRVMSPPPEAAKEKSPVKRTIGIAWFGWEGPFLLGIRSGIRQFADANNYSMRYFSHNYSHDAIIRFFNHAESYEVAGIITLPYEDPVYEESLSRLQRGGIPLVCVDRGLKNVELNAVTCDNTGGAYEATRRLIERHRRPVWYFGQLEDETSLERYHGYRQAMTEAGYSSLAGEMDITSHNLSENASHWPVETADEIIAAFWKAGDRTTPMSIFCYNDIAANALYSEAAKAGLTIGRDIFTVGFDDPPNALELSPPLSAVRQPLQEIGYEAAAMLDKLVRREIAGPVRITLPVTLALRQSD